MKRRADRVHIFSLIFQEAFDRDFNAEAAAARYFEAAGPAKDIDLEFINALFFGVMQNLAKTDALISEHLEGWAMKRLSKPDLAILRLAAYELMFTDISPKVAVNEAVVLAKDYSADETGAFVNGVLAKIIKALGKAGVKEKPEGEPE